MKSLLPLLFILLLASSCFAVIESDSIKVFAVTDSGTALSADLSLELKPGTGKVWTSIEPLIGTSTQTTEKIAVDISKKYFSSADKYDYFFTISSNASLVDGPSAGAAMTLLTISMLQGKIVPDEVALTGTITAEGGVGPVGGVFEKAKEAAKTGVKLFMVPPGETRQTVKIDNTVQSVNLIDYAQSNWGLKVVEVGNIDEVLHYAFLDIDSIDVNAQEAGEVEFVPKQIPLAQGIEPMKALTERYISEAESSLRSAKTALSGTLLDDPALIDYMLTNLNESEKTLAKSKILFEQNYLYSSANYAFLAMVNSAFVRDIAENPQLLSSGSTAFDNKVTELERKLNSFALDLNKFIPVDGLEWHVAAKERLTWAKLKVDALKSNNAIVIVVGSGEVDWDRLSKILDYEYAAAWYEISVSFSEQTKGSKLGIISGAGLSGLVDSYIANTENSLTALAEDETEDIVRRLDSAKLSRSNGWFFSALFDSASSLALANSAIYSKNRRLEELQQTLLEKTSALEEKMGNSPYSFVWARLYLDHAKYYLDASLFYLDKGQVAVALDSAKAGIDLAFLAEGIYDATVASRSHIESLPQGQFVTIAGGWQQGPVFNDLVAYAILAVLLVFGLGAFAFFASGKKFHFLKPFSFEDTLDDLLKQKRRLQERLDKGRISSSQFETLVKPVEKQLDDLLGRKREMSADYVELDLNRCKVAAFESALRKLNAQFKRMEIMEDDYRNNVAFYRKRIDLLKHLIKEEEAKISRVKRNAEDSFSKKPAPKAKGKAFGRRAKGRKGES